VNPKEFLLAQVAALRAQADALEALAESMRDLDKREEPERPETVLLDRQRMARALDVSLPTLDRLRREGLPAVFIGDSPRFEIEAALAWLRNRENLGKDPPL